MLKIGFKSVVGTMWSICYADAPIVMEVFYGEPQSQIASGEGNNVALALHKAVEVLREKLGEDDVLRWTPYVYFGR